MNKKDVAMRLLISLIIGSVVTSLVCFVYMVLTKNFSWWILTGFILVPVQYGVWLLSGKNFIDEVLDYKWGVK